jgi:hypothetical protein
MKVWKKNDYIKEIIKKNLEQNIRMETELKVTTKCVKLH